MGEPRWRLAGKCHRTGPNATDESFLDAITCLTKYVVLNFDSGAIAMDCPTVVESRKVNINENRNAMDTR